ncbi:YciI family protein [Actinocorallia sp. A-T 12471]|uniref:YciI family protein n=1 Tax=Actinocorallia sp. A-T 12471 TaxID=3089813 RepID=UPI0029D11BCA|nr:YciI family protein [Actinocorallia sp. A-T 12471]MDX6741586.1 YciI family protein [Actinocorallia sp. A-T 12471]
MRFIMFLRTPENAEIGPPPPGLLPAIGALGEEAAKAGALIDTAGFAPTFTAVRSRVVDGEITRAEGPFGEAEALAAYALYDVASRDEAVEWAEKFLAVHRDNWPGWEGEAEVRQLFGPADAPPA